MYLTDNEQIDGQLEKQGMARIANGDKMDCFDNIYKEAYFVGALADGKVVNVLVTPACTCGHHEE